MHVPLLHDGNVSESQAEGILEEAEVRQLHKMNSVCLNNIVFSVYQIPATVIPISEHTLVYFNKPVQAYRPSSFHWALEATFSYS